MIKDKDFKRMETALKIICTWAGFTDRFLSHDSPLKTLEMIHDKAAEALGRQDLIINKGKYKRSAMGN